MSSSTKSSNLLNFVKKMICKLKLELDNDEIKNQIFECATPIYDEIYYKVFPYFLVFVMTMVIIIILLVILICK